MGTNDANGAKLVHPELSYLLTGICFNVHNALGRYARERQYCEQVEKALQESKIAYQREYLIGVLGNRVDFLIEDKVILEIKAKPFVTKDDYYQLQRYLQTAGLKLGLLVNFRSRYLKPSRIIKIDTPARARFV